MKPCYKRIAEAVVVKLQTLRKTDMDSVIIKKLFNKYI